MSSERLPQCPDTVCEGGYVVSRCGKQGVAIHKQRGYIPRAVNSHHQLVPLSICKRPRCTALGAVGSP